MTPARADRLDAAASPGWGTLAELEAQPLDRLPAADFDTRALSRRLRLAGRQVPLQAGLAERAVPQPVHERAGRRPCRRCPTIGPSIEEADAEHPFRLATSPARGFLNSTFNETPTSLAQEARPTVMIHPRGRRRARHRRRRRGGARQHARAGAAARQAVRRRAPRRADRGIDLAERRLCRRPRHQHADRRRPDRALRRRGRSTTTRCGSGGPPDPSLRSSPFWRRPNSRPAPYSSAATVRR